MDLKEYSVKPDEGLYEKIERRVYRRRWVRVGGVVAAVAVVALVAVWLMPKTDAAMEEPNVVAITEMPSVITDNLSADQPLTETSIVETTHNTGNGGADVKSPSASTSLPTADVPLATLGNTTPAIIQPSLPTTVVKPEETPVAELILVGRAEQENRETGNGSDATVSAVKGDEPTPTPPHYDNVLWAPNIIFPMADDADNRVFKVQSTSVVSDFYLVVYNRGGRQVFSTNDINRSWDATRDGSPVSQGTYVWVARFRDSDGVVRQEKGTVTVIR